VVGDYLDGDDAATDILLESKIGPVEGDPSVGLAYAPIAGLEKLPDWEIMVNASGYRR